MERRELLALGTYIEELVRMYVAAHETGFHSRVAGEPLPQYKDKFLSLVEGLADPMVQDSGLDGIGEFVTGRDVILYGGAASARGPKLEDPFIVRVNNHYLWQQCNRKCDDGYNWTDGVYHGSGYSGLFAQFVNVPPAGLKFVAQNMGHKKPNFSSWARGQGVYYASYAERDGEDRERGVDPEKYEEVFAPLIEVCEQPFTGVLAAFHLLTFPIRSLHLTGFDFYEGREHVNKERDGKWYRGEHSLEDNREAMRRILKDDRSRPDKLLSQSV
jgi:hypothetical protein